MKFKMKGLVKYGIIRWHYESQNVDPFARGIALTTTLHRKVSLNYCSQNGGKFYRDPYYNGNPNIGPRIIGNLDQSP